jgi:patatin-related protein
MPNRETLSERQQVDATPAPVVERLALGEEDREEIRFAVAMNGGVSLAVWMGGVTRELDRARRSEGAYGELMRTTHSLARVDVLAGASAGGVNGALLAVAIANHSDLTPVRDLWLARGSFGEMLRDPMERDPPSLLRGDDYFLPKLRETFERLQREDGPPLTTPLQLLITATILTAEEQGYADDFGSVITDRNHRALFRFRCDPETGRNEFVGDEAAARLALAARTSASFPGAFEPSFIPIGPECSSDERPDMRGFTSFGGNRWAVDGGVLVNTPVEPLLRAIFTLPAGRQVRRVIAIVIPSPRELGPPEADDAGKLPPVLEVATASISSLPRQQTIGDQLDEIREHNLRVSSRRRRREEFLAGIEVFHLPRLALQLFPIYRRVRDGDAIEYVVSAIARQVFGTDETPRLDAASVEGLRAPSWNRARVRDVLARTERKPWLPAEWPSRALGRPDGDERWDWGLSPLERAAVVVLDVFRRALLLTPYTNLEARHSLQDSRREVHVAARTTRQLRDADARFFAVDARQAIEALRTDDQAALDDWAAGILDRWTQSVSPTLLAETARRFAAALANGAPVMRLAVDREVAAGQRLLAMLDRLAPAGADEDECLLRLLALEVVERALGPDERQPEQPLELIQMSADTPNAFDTRDSADEKLTGLQLGHFGAFYKRSWRANDWMWGRLDGAARITQVLLSPNRLRQLGYTAGEAAEAINRIALGDDPASAALLGRSWRGDAVLDELGFLDEPEHDIPESLPESARAIVRRIQLEVLREELPVVAAAVRADYADGGAPVPARHWAERVPSPADRALRPDEALELFRIDDIGLETLDGEVGTDLFTGVGTKALATAGSLLRSRHSGLISPLGPLTATVRGVLLAGYLLARGAVARSRTGSFLVLLLLAASGALVAVPLVAGTSFGFLATLALTILIGGFLLALIRSGPVVLGILLCAGASALAWCLFHDHGEESIWQDCFGWVPKLGPALPVLAIVVLAMLLGLLNWPLWLRRLRRTPS